MRETILTIGMKMEREDIAFVILSVFILIIFIGGGYAYIRCNNNSRKQCEDKGGVWFQNENLCLSGVKRIPMDD